jgi:hypothetical protein
VGLQPDQCDETLIEANVLDIVWPHEFVMRNIRVLVFNVGYDGPLSSASYLFGPHTSSDDGVSFNEIDDILKLQGMHFTLLRPQDVHADVLNEYISQHEETRHVRLVALRCLEVDL